MQSRVISMSVHPATLPRIGYSAPELIVSGDPVEYGHVHYADGAQRTVAGIWESEAGALRFESYPFDEFCYVLAGRIVLTEAEGQRQEFGPGQAFFIRKGFKGEWSMPERTRKYYVECR